MKEHWVKASEIGDFVYCKRGWWLKLNHIHGEGVEDFYRRGNIAHNILVRKILANKVLRQAAFTFIVLGIIYLILWWLLTTFSSYE